MFLKVKNPTQEQLDQSEQGANARTSLDGSIHILTPLNIEDSIWGGYKIYDDKDLVFIVEHYNFRSYIGDETSPYYKLYEFLSPGKRDEIDNYTIPPHDINYKNQLAINLYEKPLFDKGFLVKMEYYQYLDQTYDPSLKLRSESYYDKILEVDIQYFPGEDKYIDNRITTRTWWRLDDKPDLVNQKITRKQYTIRQGIQEGRRRRENIIDEAQYEVSGLILQTELGKAQFSGGSYTPQATNTDEAEQLGLNLVRHIDSQINEFIRFGINEDSQGHTSSLLDVVNSSTRTNSSLWYDENEYDISLFWLENDVSALGYTQGYTIRDVILMRLNESIFI